MFASTDADACFWNAATGACHASARWLASNRLVFSDQGLFLADLVGGVETCASAFDDADACAAADHCAYYPAAGACLPDASWSLDTIRRCVIGRGSDVDPAVTAIASLASECLARSSSEDACAAHADGKCAWMDPSSDVDAAFCAPDVIRVASEMFGARALAALAVAQTACVASATLVDGFQKRASRRRPRRLAVRGGPHRDAPRVGEVDDGSRVSGSRRRVSPRRRLRRRVRRRRKRRVGMRVGAQISIHEHRTGAIRRRRRRRDRRMVAPRR